MHKSIQCEPRGSQHHWSDKILLQCDHIHEAIWLRCRSDPGLLVADYTHFSQLIRWKLPRLVFYDLNLSSTAIKTPVGKLSALQSPILSLWAFEFHDPKRQYLIAGDAAGVFTLFEFKKNWHICNDVIHGAGLITWVKSPLSHLGT